MNSEVNFTKLTKESHTNNLYISTGLKLRWQWMQSVRNPVHQLVEIKENVIWIGITVVAAAGFDR